MNLAHCAWTASAAAVADEPKLTDWLTAIGTVGLAAVTVITLAVTVLITRADRAEASRLLTRERGDADARLRDERDHAEEVRRRERQADCARRLLGHIAYIVLVLGDLRRRLPAGGPAESDVVSAVSGLRQGLHTDAASIGDPAASDQYRSLVRLVDAVWGGKFGTTTPLQAKLLTGDIRRYAVFVRLSLGHLIESGEALDPGEPAMPRIRREAGDGSLWSPASEPAGWRQALASDPDDPSYVAPQ